MANIGPSSDTIDTIWDFIDTIVNDVFLVLVEEGIEGMWTMAVTMFVTLSPIIGFALMMSIFLYMYDKKFVSGR